MLNRAVARRVSTNTAVLDSNLISTEIKPKPASDAASTDLELQNENSLWDLLCDGTPWTPTCFDPFLTDTDDTDPFRLSRVSPFDLDVLAREIKASPQDKPADLEKELGRYPVELLKIEPPKESQVCYQVTTNTGPLGFLVLSMAPMTRAVRQENSIKKAVQKSLLQHEKKEPTTYSKLLEDLSFLDTLAKHLSENPLLTLEIKATTEVNAATVLKDSLPKTKKRLRAEAKESSPSADSRDDFIDLAAVERQGMAFWNEYVALVPDITNTGASLAHLEKAEQCLLQCYRVYSELAEYDTEFTSDINDVDLALKSLWALMDNINIKKSKSRSGGGNAIWNAYLALGFSTRDFNELTLDELQEGKRLLEICMGCYKSTKFIRTIKEQLLYVRECIRDTFDEKIFSQPKESSEGSSEKTIAKAAKSGEGDKRPRQRLSFFPSAHSLLVSSASPESPPGVTAPR